jgi:hypothetical protein
MANDFLAGLSVAVRRLDTANRAAQAYTIDLKARLAREVARHSELLDGDITRIVARRRTWHWSISDFGSSLEEEWRKEVEELNSEATSAADRRIRELGEALAGIAQSPRDEWASVRLDQFDLGDMTGFGTVWTNRIGRAAIGAAGGAGIWAGVALGAKIGAALGVEGGPPLMAIMAGAGAVAGAIASLLINPLKGVFGSIFLGKDRVLAKRRAQLERKVHPILDQIGDEFEGRKTERFATVTTGLNETFARGDAQAARNREGERMWRHIGRLTERSVDELDLVTAQALLRLSGRHRLASLVQHASRSPGTGIVVEIGEVGFAEAALYPAQLTCERVVACGHPKPNAVAGQALSLAVSLSRRPIAVARLSDAEAVVRVQTDMAEGVIDAWSKLFSHHTRRKVTLLRTDQDPHDRGSSPRGRSALPDDAVRFVADQVKVPASDLKVSATAASRAGNRRDLTRLPLLTRS